MNTIKTRKNQGFLKFVSIVMVVSVLCILFSGCGHKLSGRYRNKSGSYSVKFDTDGTCTWYQDGTYFDGTYYWDSNDECYYLDIRGNGLYTNTTLRAEPDPDGLIVDGGTVRNEIFSKRTGSNSSSTGIIVCLLIVVIILIGGGIVAVIIVLNRKNKGVPAINAVPQNMAYPQNPANMQYSVPQNREYVQNPSYAQDPVYSPNVTPASNPVAMPTQMETPTVMNVQEDVQEPESDANTVDMNTVNVQPEESVQETVDTPDEAEIQTQVDTQDDVNQQIEDYEQDMVETDETVQDINPFVPQKSFCTKCGAELKPNQNFCRRCGRKLN